MSSQGTVEPRTLLRRWLSAFAVGVLSGLLPLVLGVFGLFLAVPGLVLSAAMVPRTVSLSGFLAGLGGTWLVVWGRAIQACAGPNTPTDGCVGPDLSGWSVVPIGILVIAGLLAIASLRRA
jgi:hypothetical protein